MTALRRVFWDWSVITLGAVPLGFAAAVFARDAQWDAAAGFALASVYALLTFGEGVVGSRWERKARDADAKLMTLIDCAIIHQPDGSIIPLRQWLEPSATQPRCIDGQGPVAAHLMAQPIREAK